MGVDAQQAMLARSAAVRLPPAAHQTPCPAATQQSQAPRTSPHNKRVELRKFPTPGPHATRQMRSLDFVRLCRQRP